MALGLSLAVIVNGALRGKTFFRAAYYFPALASSAAITAIAIYLLNAGGLLNATLEALGLDALIPDQGAWFYDSDTALQSIMGLNAWTTSGTIMLFYLAACRRSRPTSTRPRRSTAPARGARSGRSPSRCSSRATSSSPCSR